MKIPLMVLGLLAAAVVRAQTAAPAASGEAQPAEQSAALLGQGANELPVNPALPTLWIIGDSTVRNGQGNGSTNAPDGQWGWGAPIEYYFDRSKINVVNRALGGTSSRSFYTANWPRVLDAVKKGDFVIMQFGHNDKNGDLTGANATLGSLNGIGEETQEVTGRGGQPETVHTFGWYLKQYIEQTRAKGATPIVCSLIPRKIWENEKIMRSNDGYFDYADWAGQAAAAEKATFVDLNAITAAKYNTLGPDKVEPLFVPIPSEHTHTNWYGAVINAESIVSGLKALKENPLASFFSAKGNALPAFDSAISPLDGTSTIESAKGAATAAASTVVSTATTASAPAMIPAGKPTLYIVGDSTANSTPSAANNILGWGNVFGTYFDPAKISVGNSARGGRSSRSYYHEGLWAAVAAKLKPGDFVLLQFGHNDGGTPSTNRAGDRPSLPGLGEETKDFATPSGTKLAFGAASTPDGATPDASVGPMETVHTFGWYMRLYVAEAKAKGAHIIVLTTTVRNNWPDGVLERGPGQYSPWSREIAASQNVEMADLTNLVADKYEKMSRDDVTALYNPTITTDTTHSSAAGADFNAASVVSLLKALKGGPFAQYFSAKGQAVPAADAKYVAENLPQEKPAAASDQAK